MKVIFICFYLYMLLCVCEGFIRESKKRDYNKEKKIYNYSIVFLFIL